MTATVELDTYRQTGYLVRPLLSGDDVTALLFVADTFQQLAADLTHSVGDFNLEAPAGGYLGQDGSSSDDYRGTLRKVANAAHHAPLITTISGRPALIGLAAALLDGADCTLVHSVMWYKPPQIGSPKPPHQDAPYLDGDPADYVTIWIALDECTLDNGCLQVVPGSHHHGVIAHTGAEKQIPAEAWQQAGPVAVPLQPGEAIAFDPCLLHASDPNRSDRSRRALMLRYQRAGTHAG